MIYSRSAIRTNNCFLFHVIVCHFLVNETGGQGVGEKNNKVWHEGRGLKKFKFRNDVLFKWTFNQIVQIRLTYYSAVLLIYTHWKHQKTQRFSDVFRGYRLTTPGCNRLILKYDFATTTKPQQFWQLLFLFNPLLKCVLAIPLNESKTFCCNCRISFDIKTKLHLNGPISLKNNIRVKWPPSFVFAHTQMRHSWNFL